MTRAEFNAIERMRRVAKATLDLSYAFEKICKQHKLDDYEVVELLQESAQRSLRAFIRRHRGKR